MTNVSKVAENLEKETCLACDGAGEVPDGNPNDPTTMTYRCPICHGYGSVDPDENMTMETYVKVSRFFPRKVKR